VVAVQRLPAAVLAEAIPAGAANLPVAKVGLRATATQLPAPVTTPGQPARQGSAARHPKQRCWARRHLAERTATLTQACIHVSFDLARLSRHIPGYFLFTRPGVHFGHDAKTKIPT